MERALLAGVTHASVTCVFLAMGTENLSPLFFVVLGLVMIAHVLISSIFREPF